MSIVYILVFCSTFSSSSHLTFSRFCNCSHIFSDTFTTFHRWVTHHEWQLFLLQVILRESPSQTSIAWIFLSDVCKPGHSWRDLRNSVWIESLPKAIWSPAPLLLNFALQRGIRARNKTFDELNFSTSWRIIGFSFNSRQTNSNIQEFVANFGRIILNSGPD